ncbi:MAG: hypothetical protein K2G77_08945 [Muribaculaceae bacterium]|nr:hypothetical protein [Muribaculaceae bacterium]
MSQTADIQLISLEQILEILRNQALAITNISTSSRYLRALDSLESSVFSLQSSDYGQALRNTAQSADTKRESSNGQRSSLEKNSSLTVHHLSLTLTDWLVSLWLTAIPFATASLYLDIISSLYGSAVKANLLPPTKLFSQLKADLKALGPEGWKQGIDDEIFDRALRLTKNASHLIADDAIAASLVIWSLTHSLQPLTEIALLKRDNLNAENGKRKTEDSDNSSFIVHRSSLKKSRYVFPLRQSQRTPKQLQAHISKIVNALFRRARLPQATDPYQTVEALWAYAALRTGIPASTIVSYLGHAPLGLTVLRLSHAKAQRKMYADGGEESSHSRSLLPEDEHTQEEENFAPLREVGKIFLENPPRWYAMSLRPGVRFTQVCRRLELLLKTQDSRLKTLADVQLFYPSEEIARAIGKKIVVRERPFIHSVVFFRAKLTDIGRLFSKIGDLAWCYRQSARPGAPYADISESQFRLFQQTIARFTPDYEVAPIGELELNEGDRVEILGGLFAGQEAIMERRLPSRPTQSGKVSASEDLSLKPEDSHTVYRLNVIGDNGIEWRINIDSRLLKPSAKNQE